MLILLYYFETNLNAHMPTLNYLKYFLFFRERRSSLKVVVLLHVSRMTSEASNTDAPMASNIDSFEQVREGKALVNFRKTNNQVFYNPIQEFNRDLSISCINVHSQLNGNKKLRILEALAASGIRSMRYALEIENCHEIVANDLDRHAVELIEKNIGRSLLLKYLFLFY